MLPDLQQRLESGGLWWVCLKPSMCVRVGVSDNPPQPTTRHPATGPQATSIPAP